MWIVYTIAIILTLMIVLFFLLKVRLIIDSPSGEIELRVRPLLKARALIHDNGNIHYRLKVPFYSKEGEVWESLEAQLIKDEEKKKRSKDKKKKTKKGVRKRIRSFSDLIELSRTILQSFKVRKFRLGLNTESAIWNAWLYPVLHAYGTKGHDTEIRFFGPTLLILDIENSLPRVTGTFIKYYITKKRRT